MTTHTGEKRIGFGLIFFASSETSYGNEDKYRLVIESAKIADGHGFSSIWIPERHFTKDGWLYPNPAVLQAAIARETRQIKLRAGSVVLPLHNPIRVAEEWAMVDNLSGGRVGLSFASGWHPNDFALFPEHYEDRNQEMYRGIEVVRKLWRGESIQVKGGDGNLVDIKTFPPPLQPELPFWLTAAGNPKTFAGAGEIGANLLTHMYNQSVDELAEKIRIYREGRARKGFDPATGQVSVMLHTFVGLSEEYVRARARDPFCNYLRSASYLLNAIAYSRGQKVDLASLSEQDVEEYLQFVFERLISTQRVLFGTPESCLKLVKQLKDAGVDEIACQLDFGLDVDVTLESMHYLNQLKERSDAELAFTNPVADQAMPVLVVSSTQPDNGVANKGAYTDNDATPASADLRLEDVRVRCREVVPVAEFYEGLHARGIQLEGSFQGIEQLWRGEDEALGRVRIRDAQDGISPHYQVYPVLLDACLQVLIATLPAALVKNDDALYLPTGVRSFRLHQQPGNHVWSHARLTTARDAALLEGNVRILGEDGQLLVEADGIQLQRSAPAAQPQRSTPQAELEQWLYELRWEAAASDVQPAVSDPASGKWLVFLDSAGIGQKLVDLLTARGESCVTVVPGYSYQKMSERQYRINPERPAEVQRVIKDVTAAAAPFRGVVHLWSLDTTPVDQTTLTSLEEDRALGVGNALYLIQGLLTIQDSELPRLWLVSQGAQAVVANDSLLAVAQSPLWGLGRSCAMEHPEFWGGIVDSDPHSSVQEAAEHLLAVVTERSREDQVAFRGGQRYVARMVRRQALPPQTLRLSSTAGYLITGGLWGLGLEVARWMAQKGARHLVLLGRTQLPPREAWSTVEPGTRLAQQIEGVRSLEALGAHVYYGAVDVTNEVQLRSFLQEYTSNNHPPIKGILHAASVWQDHQGQSLVRPLANLDTMALRDVFGPKVLGGWLLHTLFKDARLDFFIAFSSGASLFGSAAQGNYAAAGAFLDALAHYQRAHGQPAISFDWGAVSQTGFGATAEGLRVHEYWESHGIQRITPADVLSALDLLVPQQIAQIGVLKLDWGLLRDFFPQITQLPLVAHLLDEVCGSEQEDTGSPSVSSLQEKENAVVRALLSVPEEERLQQVQTYLREQVAAVLRVPSAKLDIEQPLTTLGLDSLMAIELKNRIELELSVRIPIVTFLQGPSIEQFAGQVMDQLVAQVPVAAAVALPATAYEQQDNGSVLVVSNSDAEQLLTRIDQLSDSEVDAALSQMLQEQQEQEEDKRNAAVASSVDAQEAQQLLEQLSQLSDDRVDALLNQIVQEEGFN